jgi:hypothetical protein
MTSRTKDCFVAIAKPHRDDTLVATAGKHSGQFPSHVRS